MSLEPIAPLDDLSVVPVQYEYLDHTADVQIHSWGTNLVEAFEQCAIGMFGYITELNTVTPSSAVELEVTGDDLNQLLYRFLDELLFLFCAEPFFVPMKVKIVEFDAVLFKIKVRCFGEEFNLNKHPQGTEVKAITYSNMQINQAPNRVDIFVIVDI